MASALGDSLSAAMDAMNPFRLSTDLAARRGDLWDSDMTMYVKRMGILVLDGLNASKDLL